MKKEMNNKGFSLVELIIVIAIMAVLMGVLAPQLIGKIEESKIQSDRSAMSEVANAIKIAMAKESVYDKVTDGTTVTVGGGSVSCTVTELQTELGNTVPDGVKFSSKKFTSGGTGTYDIKITIDLTTNTFKLTTSAPMKDDQTGDYTF